MRLSLKKPLLFFDLETTGIHIEKDRIVEISYLKIMPDGTEESMTWRVNPLMPIPQQSTAIHGITDDDVKDCPIFSEIAETIAERINGCDLAGFNSNRFDIPLLAEEFLRVGIDVDLNSCKCIDVQNIYHKMEPRNLKMAYKHYCGKELTNMHQAEHDTRATYEVLMSQLDMYSELENDVEALSSFSSFTNFVDFSGRMIYNENGEEVFNFGKYKGQIVVEALKKDPNFYQWVMKGDFSLDTKKKLTNIFERLKQQSKDKNGGKDKNPHQ